MNSTTDIITYEYMHGDAVVHLAEQSLRLDTLTLCGERTNVLSIGDETRSGIAATCRKCQRKLRNIKRARLGFGDAGLSELARTDRTAAKSAQEQAVTQLSDDGASVRRPRTEQQITDELLAVRADRTDIDSGSTITFIRPADRRYYVATARNSRGQIVAVRDMTEAERQLRSKRVRLDVGGEITVERDAEPDASTIVDWTDAPSDAERSAAVGEWLDDSIAAFDGAAADAVIEPLTPAEREALNAAQSASARLASLGDEIKIAADRRTAAVRTLHSSLGWSLGLIAERLGVSRSAVQQMLAR